MRMKDAACEVEVSSRRSYVKGLLVAAGSGLLLAAGAGWAASIVDGGSRVLLAAIAALAMFAASSVVFSGWLVLVRERRAQIGAPDLLLSANADRNETRLETAPIAHGRLRRRLAQLLQGHELMVGDWVEIRSLAEIESTLDAKGQLDAVPFMPEMARYCKGRARVFRCLDKVYDYGKSKRMRQVDRCVLLVGLHCDGSAHGGCQAGCSLIWKADWLRRASAALESALPLASTASVKVFVPHDPVETTVYECQFTRLSACSRSLSAWSVGKELRPLVCDNFTPRAMFIGWATRWFNEIQCWRGGATFPTCLRAGTQPTETPIEPGCTVRVRPAEVIASTLNAQNKNRGLWFDRDMLKHCRHSYRVSRRVDRIIDVNSGRLITMKTPCYVLEGVRYSGEFQQFGPQHEDLYWRSIWLESAERVASA